MADLNIHLDVSVTSAKARWFAAFLLVGLISPELGSENVTLTTYYPAPSGIYAQMITTGNTYLARDPGGSVGIGTTSPASMLSVSGGVQIGDDAAVCTAAKAGTQRYSAGGMQFCNGSSWAAVGGSGTYRIVTNTAAQALFCPNNWFVGANCAASEHVTGGGGTCTRSDQPGLFQPVWSFPYTGPEGYKVGMSCAVGGGPFTFSCTAYAICVM